MPAPFARETTSDPAAVGVFRHSIEQLCGDAGCTPMQCADVALAVSEALSNVVMHAYVGLPAAGPMRLRAVLDDHRLRVEVEDDGIGLRPRLDSPGGGLGLALIASLTTELEFVCGPSGRGTLVRMTFALA
jgi:anti-sigma regulatory factor (Ser/Thr protein kinase)